MNNAINLEKDLLKNNIIKLKRRMRNSSHLLTLSSLTYFNLYLKPSYYDLIIVDDANIYDADDYYDVIKGHQVIVAGEFSYRFSQSNNVLSRLRDEDTMIFRHRYIPTPLSLLHVFKNLKGVPVIDENNSIEVRKNSPLEVIKEILNSGEYKLNYICDNYDVIYKLFNSIYEYLVDKYNDSRKWAY